MIEDTKKMLKKLSEKETFLSGAGEWVPLDTKHLSFLQKHCKKPPNL